MLHKKNKEGHVVGSFVEFHTISDAVSDAFCGASWNVIGLRTRREGSSIKDEWRAAYEKYSQSKGLFTKV